MTRSLSSIGKSGCGLRARLVRGFKLLGYILTLFVSILIVSEISLRIYVWMSPDAGIRYGTDYLQRIQRRLATEWLDPDQKDPFCPPFLVYADRGYDDDSRLKEIFDATRLPPGQTWNSHDFLQADDRAEATRYTIHSNSLGFRGAERSADRPPDTFRIIVLGAYHAFGHGVSDDEAYPACLEKDLNEAPGTHPRFEVWNGGREAGTAIIGLARMKYEIFSYHPDLIILDYGFVDALTWSDNVMPIVLRLPDRFPYNAIRSAIRSTAPIWGRSLLLGRMLDTVGRFYLAKNIVNFTQTMRAMIALARRHGVAVILVKQLPADVSHKVYLSLLDDPADFISVKDVFLKSPPTDAQTQEFFNHPSWITEVDPRVRLPQWIFTGFAPYRLDFFQLSPLGNKVLADAICQRILARLHGAPSQIIPTPAAGH